MKGGGGWGKKGRFRVTKRRFVKNNAKFQNFRRIIGENDHSIVS